jgi:phosphatidylserine/phosphatidylglycerophosphate/cardiolipin synthase-like enzyme
VRDQVSREGLTVQVVAGTHAVLFGFDVRKLGRGRLMGFAIERKVLPDGPTEWLPNFLRFAANDRPDGPTTSRENPLQAFQWGDYGVLPGQRLRYRVLALYGTSARLEVRGEVEVDVQTEPADDGRHAIYFNRGVAGSQAYARKFGSGSPLNIPEARVWLSRGLEEGLLAFIAKAQNASFGLRGAFYEFSYTPALQALYDAYARQVDIKLVVSCPSDTHGWPTPPAGENADAIHAIEKLKGREHKSLAALSVPRRRTEGIAHSKFIVLLKDGRPQAVWTGSTNITAGGLYGQSNVGHAVTDAELAAAYLRYWEQLANDPDLDELRPWVDQHSPVPTTDQLDAAPAAGKTSLVLSPRGDKEPLDRYEELMGDAKQAVFLTAAFGVHDRFDPVLKDDRDIPRYLLLEKRGNDMELARADPDNHIATGAYIGQPGGYRQFLQEQLTGLNRWVRFIHTKYLLIDPLTDHPVVVTGSANFSDASTVENDENMLLISRDERVADIYLSEFMRLFTHLRFRARVGAKRTDRAPDPREPEVSAPRHLAETGRWADEYFVAKSPKERERLLFSGQLPG